MHNAPNQATGEAMPAANRITSRAGRRYRRPHTGSTGGPSGPSGTITPAVPFWPADPLLALVEAYRAERDRFRASTTESDADFNADAALMHRLFEQLTHDAPRCRTTAAACAALRLVAEDMEAGRSDVQEALLLKVLEWVRQPYGDA